MKSIIHSERRFDILQNDILPTPENNSNKCNDSQTSNNFGSISKFYSVICVSFVL